MSTNLLNVFTNVFASFEMRWMGFAKSSIPFTRAPSSVLLSVMVRSPSCLWPLANSIIRNSDVPGFFPFYERRWDTIPFRQ